MTPRSLLEASKKPGVVWEGFLEEAEFEPELKQLNEGCPPARPIASVLPSSVPEGTEMFEVYGNPGVDVYICPNVERDRERADTRRWHFGVGSQIIVVMNSPSNELNDSHVSAPPCLGGDWGWGDDPAHEGPVPSLIQKAG